MKVKELLMILDSLVAEGHGKLEVVVGLGDAVDPMLTRAIHEVMVTPVCVGLARVPMVLLK